MAARMTEKADDDSKTVEELAEKYYEGSSDLAVTEIERDAKFSNGGTESFELYGAGVHIYSDPSKGTSSRYDLYSFGKHVPVTD